MPKSAAVQVVPFLKYTIKTTAVRERRVLINQDSIAG